MFYFTSILLLPLWAICLWTYSRRDRLAKYAHWPNLALCASRKPTATEAVDKICFLSHEHETATVLADMVQADGVKAWPPKTNHDHSTWPVALRPYKLMYLELASLLPVAKPSLDDIENSIAINRFRLHFCRLMQQYIHLDQVTHVLESVANGDEDAIAPETYNAFYSCISWCRHAYR